MNRFLPQIAALSFIVAAASAAPLDGPAERSRYSDTVTIKFGAGNYQWLESEAKRLIESKERFGDGTWKLPRFYAGLDPKRYLDKSATPEARLAAFESWILAFPDSSTCLIAKAETLTSMAWDARGSGYANTVSEEQWKAFAAKLEEARAALESIPEAKRLDPHWYNSMQTIALGQSWDAGEYDALFARALALEPLYQDLYWSKAYRLLPRWHGEPGDWEKFADDSIRSAGAEGDSMYTRIAWSLERYYKNFFAETRISWPKMQKGFEQIMAQYPGSRWNLNNYCRFAFLARDRATVKRLTAEIGEDFHPTAWYSKSDYLRACRFGSGEAEPKPQTTLSRPDSGSAHSLCYSPDGKSLVAAYESGEVVVWDLGQGKPAAVFPGSSPATAVRWSPDGKLIAVAYGGRDAEAKGEVKIWRADSRELLTTIDGWSNTVVALAFQHKGSLLAMAGGTFEGKKSGELRLWDAATGKTSSLDWAAKHTHGLHALAFSPDDRFLAADCNRSVTVWDLVEQKMAHESVQGLRKWVNALAYSPDGKSLAAATGGWNKAEERKAAPVIFRTPEYGWESPAFEAISEDLNAIAWTSDGNRIVTGGRDAMVYFWDQASGKLLHSSYVQSSPIEDLAISPDGKTLAVAAENGSIGLWAMP